MSGDSESELECFTVCSDEIFYDSLYVVFTSGHEYIVLLNFSIAYLIYLQVHVYIHIILVGVLGLKISRCDRLVAARPVSKRKI